ncbi:ArsR/SmtB family transcription factor [Actinosynnema sp. CS-041913]|uniref:ArsR/SmtB family transcription factor n=1 Tax=Actinosynnema sp. CS-041913 TaxID=3239917 RepID=UPI003D8E6267
MKTPHDTDDDPVWRALAHPLRRAILDVLRAGPRTTGELVEALEMSRHVVMQHLGVLREADLVLVEPHGRRRVNHLNPVPIQQIHRRWVAEFEQPWAAALVGLKDTVERAREKEQDVG